MSLLVRYTLASPDSHDAQRDAMAAFIADLKSEGVAGLHYAAYSTEEPTEFIGVLDFTDEAAFQAFQASDAFAAYKTRIGAALTGPPKTTRMTAIASTRD